MRRASRLVPGLRAGVISQSYEVAVTANMKGYLLSEPIFGHIEAAPKPGDATISAVAEFLVGFGVFVFGGRIGAGAETGPIILLD
jgi:hypothetical protein